MNKTTRKTVIQKKKKNQKNINKYDATLLVGQTKTINAAVRHTGGPL